MNDGSAFPTRNDLLIRLKAAADWVLRSHEVCGRTGSAGYYSSIGWLNGFKKWSTPYPETTGYIIPTLISYSRLTNEPKYAEIAVTMADWLMTLQAADGWLPGGYFQSSMRSPSVFNTGQIIKGFMAAYEYSGHDRFLHGSVKASLWLTKVQDADGAWRQYAYQSGFSPSYYSEVCWPMLSVWKAASVNEIKTSAVKALDYIRGKQKENGVIADWGFKQREGALTHTIGYAIRGMLESSLILGNEGERFWATGFKASEALRVLQESNGALAGRYDETWKASSRFVCLTGNAQMVLCWLVIYKIVGDSRFLSAALAALDVVSRCQFMPKVPHENNGGVPGSKPIWGGYMRFKYPNWGVKYYMDAIMEVLGLPCESKSNA